MFSVEVFKYILIVSTALLGIIGTVYEFKKKGKLNTFGKTAVVVLIFLLCLSIIIETMTNKSYREKDLAVANQLKV